MLLTADQQSVADANSLFYGALTNRDLVAMERLWFPAEWVECVHPGMGPIRGWDAVRESWGVLFAAAGSLMVAADGRADSPHRRCRLGRVRRADRQHDRGAHGVVDGPRDQHLRAP